MIKYKLACKNCDLTFDSWFASSREYEKLRNKNLLNCHNCNSNKVEKTLMAPKYINKSDIKIEERNNSRFKKINKKIQEYRKFIKNNFDYVGKNFANEARLIHYSDKKKSKGIYGIASKDEVEELKEEGIKTETIPWIDDKSN